MSSNQQNEGEGNKTAARHYNDKATDFAKSGRVDEQAKKARDALEGGEGHALKQAENEGRSRAKGEDPALKQ